MDEQKDNALEFVDTYHKLEKRVNEASGEGYEHMFSERLGAACQKNCIIKNHVNEINNFHDLCNGLVYRNNQHETVVLAEPIRAIVDNLIEVTELICRKFNIMEFAQSPVKTVNVDEDIPAAYQAMAELHTSKMPVYENDQYIGMITLDGIAVWAYEGKGADKKVRDVMVPSGKDDMVAFLSKNCEAHEALQQYQENMKKGIRLTAIMITETGQQTEPIQGIITVSDVPKIMAAYAKKAA